MNIDAWQSELSLALDAEGESYPERLKQILLSRPPTSTEEEKSQVIHVVRTMQRRILKKAAAGEVFGDLGRVADQFGQPLEKVYGISAGPFLDVARAFWTFETEFKDLLPAHNDKIITHALAAVESNFRELFFPTPGPLVVPVKQRREAQREFLQEFGPEINIDRFLSENPVLLYQARSGCLGSVALCLLVAAGAFSSSYGIH